MDRNSAREMVRGYLADYLERKGINPRKPFRCLNPDHEDKHPSMSYDRTRQKVKCFSCGKSYDIFDLIGMDYGLSSPKDIFAKAYSLYGINVDSTDHKPAVQQEQTADNYSAYYQHTAVALEDSPALAYLLKRGISKETANKFHLGYDCSYKTFYINEQGKNTYSEWQALIIPTSPNSYIARTIDEHADKKNRYRKKGSANLFNIPAMYTDKPAFVVEGEIDALSIIEAGGQAIGLGSADNYHKLMAQVLKKTPTQPLILALDTDDAGQNIENELATDLTNSHIPFIRYNPYGTAKDANEALTANREQFIAEIKKAEQMPEAELKAEQEKAKKEYLQKSASAQLQSFLAEIKASASTPAIKTGFRGLDRILDGGLYEGLYIIGAISSLGKTTLALQLMDNLAQGGQDVLIFSLEMARNELMSKSISRLTYMLAGGNLRNAKTARGIMAGARYSNYSQQEKELINKAVEAYKEYAGHIFIFEGVGDIGVKDITAAVENHISTTGNKPVVLIDYLQILAPYDELLRGTDKQNTDKSVLELKRLSRDKKIPVIGISSFNRDSYKPGSFNNGKVTTADFKESGAIEYSADVLIGLEFEGAGIKGYDEKTEKQKDPRQIRVVVMKNRNGKAWETDSMNYYPMFNYFTETALAAEGFNPAANEINKDPFSDLRA